MPSWIRGRAVLGSQTAACQAPHGCFLSRALVQALSSVVTSVLPPPSRHGNAFGYQSSPASLFSRDCAVSASRDTCFTIPSSHDSSPDASPAGALIPGVARLLPEAWLNTAVGLCLSDEAGMIVAANPAFCKSTGYPSEEVEGLSLLCLQPAESTVAAYMAHVAIIAGRSPPSPITYLHQSGRPLFAHVTDTRVASPLGRFYRLTSLMDLARETQTGARLEQLQRPKNFVALAGTISNDFNHVLAIIMGYTSFIQDGAGDVRRVLTAVQGIDKAVQRAADLIKQTLSLTRQTAPTLQRVDLSGFVKEMARSAAANENGSLQVELALQERLALASIDPRHVSHGFEELCRKAVEGMGRGARLRLSTMGVVGTMLQARFSKAHEPLYALFEARFAPAVESGSIAPEQPGWERRRDLSLVMVEGIATSHRGCLEVVQLEGGSIAFHLFFPTLPDPEPVLVAPPAPEHIAPPAGSTGAGTVLIVDDDESLLHALGFALERRGLRVLKARNGFEAVETYRQHTSRIDLVLCDLGLPRMSGWKAFMKMKGTSPDVSVIVMSGHLEPALHAEILRAGARGFLQKPFAIAQAVSIVEELFAHPDRTF